MEREREGRGSGRMEKVKFEEGEEKERDVKRRKGRAYME